MNDNAVTFGNNKIKIIISIVSVSRLAHSNYTISCMFVILLNFHAWIALPILMNFCTELDEARSFFDETSYNIVWSASNIAEILNWLKKSRYNKRERNHS